MDGNSTYNSRVAELTSTASELKRDLNLFSAINLVVGGVIGSGIFLVAADIANIIASPGMILIAWVVGGMLSLAGCLSYAELSSTMPRSGGQYVFLREAYGEPIAFLNGWTQFLAVQAGSIASVAACFGLYAGYFLPFSDMGLRWVAVAVIVILTVINYYGVRHGGLVNNIFTIAKVAAILLLVGAGLSFTGGGSLSGSFENFFSTDGMTLSAFGLAMIAVLWGYQGWDYTTFIAEEVQDPKRNIPKALTIGMLIIIAIYVITNLAYLNTMSVTEIANSKLPAADVATIVIGPLGAAFISIAIMISCFGSDDANIMSAPRIYYAMAKDGLFFKKFGEVHPKYKTPGFSILVGGLWSCILVLTNSFDQLYSLTVFAAFTFYALGGVAVFILRKKYPDIERPYKAPSWIVVTFIIISLVFVGNTLVTNLRASLFGLGVIAIGILMYFYFKAKKDQGALEG